MFIGVISAIFTSFSQATDAVGFVAGWSIGECDGTPDADPCNDDDSEARDQCYSLIDPNGELICKYY